MGHHEPTFSFTIADDRGDPLATLEKFLELNGYSLDKGSGQGLRARRGTPSASWFSSDMSRLYTELTIEVDDDKVDLSYRVTTTGQHLTDEDRQFWQREAAAVEQALHDDGELIDLRPEEAKRAKQVTSEVRNTGVWAAFIVFAMVIIFGLIADRLGIL